MIPKFPSPSKLLEVAGPAAAHIFTAFGAVLGLFALLAAADGRWQAAFAWLGAALFVDGADGPFARYVKVKDRLPRFSGEELDHVVDYLNYVAVPAFILAKSSIVPADLRVGTASAIMLASLYHFADTESKASEGYFVGFPAIWNLVVLYAFVLGLPQTLSFVLIALCICLTFVPLYWLHPVRVRRFRPLTAAIGVFWILGAIVSVWSGFPGPFWAKAAFICAAIYFVALGLLGTALSKNSNSA